MKTTDFVNNKCKVVYLSGFVLEGIITEVNKAGITLSTTQKTSFINWHVIRDISFVEDDF